MEGDLHHWEDEIDIDDPDLSFLLNPDTPGPPRSLLLPPLRACSQTLVPEIGKGGGRKDPIPGPAGSVQSFMRRNSSSLSRNPNPNRLRSDHPLTEEEEEEDWDFKLGPWLSVISRNISSVDCEYTGIGFRVRITDWVHQEPEEKPCRSYAPGTTRRHWNHIGLVVGIVKSCVPNGLGDLFITLKDPTGTIGASVHRKVLLQCNLDGDISVGCVLVLKQVAVFFPARSACYLNITPNNVVKLISKDCNMPRKEKMPSSKVGQSKQPLTTRGNFENDAALNEGRRCISIDNMMASRKSGLAGCLPTAVTTIQTEVATTQRTTKGDATTCIALNMAPRADLTANQDRVGHDPVNTGSDTVRVPAKTNIRTAEPKKVFTTVSVLQWTDEQLMELLADFPDDAN